MARDILSEYGNDISHPQAPRATSGGDEVPRDVMNYESPTGPLDMHYERPGLGGGTNCGSGQMPTSGLTSGGPGNHGTNHGNKGSQGSY
jgi:hypothetical protein